MPRKAGQGSPHNPAGKSRDEFEDFERDQWKRPRVPPVGQEGRAKAQRYGFTRASTLGGTLEDQFGLGQWRMRQVAYGISRRRDLLLAAQAVRTNDGEADKAKLGEIADAALEAAESGAAATIGTAIHALTELVDSGGEAPHVDGEARAALDAYGDLTRGFAKLAIEQKIVCDRHKVAGTFDRLLSLMGPMVTPDGERLPAGTVVLGDLKTSSTSTYFGLKFAVQLAEYAHGVPFDIGAYKRIEWSDVGPGAAQPHQRWALIVHVPTGNPDGSGLHWVDIESGLELSELAIMVRDQRKRKDLVVPAQPPSIPDVLTRTALVAEIAVAPSKDRIDTLWRSHRSVWAPVHTTAAKARLSELAATG